MKNIHIPFWAEVTTLLTAFVLVLLFIGSYIYSEKRIKDQEVFEIIYKQQNLLSEAMVLNTNLENRLQRSREVTCQYAGHNWIFDYYPRKKMCIRCGVERIGFEEKEIHENISNTMASLRKFCGNKK